MNQRKPPVIVTIVCHDDGNGDFDIHVGEHLVQHLGWDEMLGSIAVLTHPQLGPRRHGIVPAYARLEHIDDLLFRAARWREMCPPKDKEVVAGLLEAAGNTEAAIETRAAVWRAEQTSKGE